MKDRPGRQNYDAHTAPDDVHGRAYIRAANKSTWRSHGECAVWRETNHFDNFGRSKDVNAKESNNDSGICQSDVARVNG